MRKWPGVFILLLMFGVSNAISYDMELNKNVIGAYENIQVHYTISFDDSTAIQYSLTLDGQNYTEVLKSESATTYLIENTYIFSSSNIPAGNYNLTLSFTTSEGSTQYRKAITIEPTPMFLLSKNRFDVVCFKNTTKKSITIHNTGNVDLDMGFDLEGSVQLTIAPTTFVLPRASEQEVNITLTRPLSNRNFNVTFEGSYGDTKTSKRIIFDVIIPDIKVLFDADFEMKNQTEFFINFSNMGNIEQNVTFTISYFVMEGVREKSFYKIIGPETNLSFSQAIDLPENSKILSISATYLNNQGNKETITKNYGIFGIALPTSLLNAFAMIWNNSTYRGIFISALVVFMIYLLYVFVLKKKIFRKK